ncbi:uncharacterized protein LOC120446394 [Drosophila santomea]|uniref:uncharacterized protein LOC120446394 n=1 Tax=Drosophila santomea TaxID=129105 RepID=UPI0019536C46|nr:uncharacterized protein LOC120446394 [Drosophila santomea]
MNLEGISMVIKLFEDNVHKLQGNLRSYQTQVQQIQTELTKRWTHADRLDRSLIPLHDHLVGSLSEVNAHVMKLNLQLQLNRQFAQLREDENSVESIDNQDSSIHSGLQANERIAKEYCHSSEPASLESCTGESSMEMPVDLSVRVVVQVASLTKQLDEISVVNDTLLPLEVSDNKCNNTESHVDEIGVTVKPYHEERKARSRQPSLAYSQNCGQSIESDLSQLRIEEIPVASMTVPETSKTSNPVPPCAPLPVVKQETQTLSTGVSNKISKNYSNLPTSWLLDDATVEPTSTTEKSPQLPKSTRNRFLLPPTGGTETTSFGIYYQILKNMTAFPANTIVSAVLVHVNLEDNCVYVAKWGTSSKRIQQLLQRQLSLQELEQLPDYGDIFAVHDGINNIITRITINSSSVCGGYDGYLIDYGEHIHLDGNETIYKLPDDIKRLPAEAIRCDLTNCDIANMSRFLYQFIKIRVHQNNGTILLVEPVNDGISRPTNTPGTKYPAGVTEEDMAMLNEIGESTSDPLKAVLGFHPKDEQRICRHYDPKLNGCFKGNSCRLAHEPFAPDGATKDVEVAGALPETTFDTPVRHKVGSTVNILITFINGPTEVYAQFLDGSPPLVWDKKEVPEGKRIFKSKPRLLDIVLALYSDGCFYRAQIIDEFETEYKIFYVDYGNTEFVPLRCLAPCEYVDSLKPHRSVSCHMEGVVRSTYLTQQKTIECIEYLKSKLLNTEMNVLLVGRLPDGFLIRFLGEWAAVPQQLVKRDYAQVSSATRRVSIDNVKD